MKPRLKTPLMCASVLGGCVLLSLVIKVFGAKREELDQTLEVGSSWELSEGRRLVRPLPKPEHGDAVNVTAITRYPFGFAVVETGGDGNPPAAAKPPVLVQTASLAPGTARRSVLAFGTVEAAQDAQVAVQVRGRVKAVHLALGRALEQGQALLELDDRDYTIALRQADADLARTQANAQEAALHLSSLEEQVQTAQQTLEARARERERWTRLSAESVASRDRADQADTAWRAALAQFQSLDGQLAVARATRGVVAASLQQAQAAREAAALALERCTVRAPFAGRVAGRMVEVGEYVAPGQVVGRVVAQRNLRIRVHVREEEALALAPGAAASVTLPGVALPRVGDDQPQGLAARVEGVAAAVDPNTRKVAVDVVLDDPSGRLMPGLFARVRLEAGQVDDVVLLPDDAVVTDEDGQYVYVVEDDTARKVPVTLGWRQGESRLLVAGPERWPCEVVTAGTGLLFDGARIVRQRD